MIDQKALIDPGARLGNGAKVGPFTIIEDDVEIGDDTEIGSHCVIRSGTRIGKSNRISQFCSIGDEPQHLGYAGEPTKLEIGDRNTIREYCTINRGSTCSDGVTRVGNDNFFMAYVHIAHDCKVSNHTIFANAASLAGQVEVGDNVIFGGFSLVHQFCKIGPHCITGIGSVIVKDVSPFVVCAGNPAKVHGINIKGLKRRGFGEDRILDIKRAYRVVFREGLEVKTALSRLSEQARDNPDIAMWTAFLENSTRGVVR